MTRRALLGRLARYCSAISLQERAAWEHTKHTPYEAAYQACAYRFQNMYCLLDQLKAELVHHVLDTRSTAAVDLVAESEAFCREVKNLRKRRFSV